MQDLRFVVMNKTCTFFSYNILSQLVWESRTHTSSLLIHIHVYLYTWRNTPTTYHLYCYALNTLKSHTDVAGVCVCVCVCVCVWQSSGSWHEVLWFCLRFFQAVHFLLLSIFSFFHVHSLFFPAQMVVLITLVVFLFLALIAYMIYARDQVSIFPGSYIYNLPVYNFHPRPV